MVPLTGPLVLISPLLSLYYSVIMLVKFFRPIHNIFKCVKIPARFSDLSPAVILMLGRPVTGHEIEGRLRDGGEVSVVLGPKCRSFLF
jgi:hypothetical protein